MIQFQIVIHEEDGALMFYGHKFTPYSDEKLTPPTEAEKRVADIVGIAMNAAAQQVDELKIGMQDKDMSKEYKVVGK